MADLRLVTTSAAPQGLPPLIVRLGLNDDFLLHEFEGLGSHVIARTISQAKAAPALGRLAREHYLLGLLVDPDTWLNQLPVDERPPSFGAARFASPVLLNLAAQPLTAADEDAYVRAALEELTLLGASIYVAPYHLGGGPDCPIRSLDLRLARRTTARFREMRLSEPRVGERFPVARQVFACIAIDPKDLLDPLSRATLVTLYSNVDVDGFVLKIVGLSEQLSVSRVRAVADFAFSLSVKSGRDVVLGGGKNLALAFVGAGLPAAILGIGEGEVFRVRRRRGGGGARPVYHSVAMRSVDTFARSVSAGYRAEMLFLNSPCPCGHHRADLPPANRRELKLHTMSTRIRSFADAASWSATGVEAELRERVAQANALAMPLGYPQLPETFLAVASEAAATRRRWRRGQLGIE